MHCESGDDDESFHSRDSQGCVHDVEPVECAQNLLRPCFEPTSQRHSTRRYTLLDSVGIKVQPFSGVECSNTHHSRCAVADHCLCGWSFNDSSFFSADIGRNKLRLNQSDSECTIDCFRQFVRSTSGQTGRCDRFTRKCFTTRFAQQRWDVSACWRS